jgi:hypothetical protein
MYALRKRKIPHSLAHIPNIANGYVVRIMNRLFTRTRHWLQHCHRLDTAVTVVGMTTALSQARYSSDSDGDIKRAESVAAAAAA